MLRVYMIVLIMNKQRHAVIFRNLTQTGKRVSLFQGKRASCCFGFREEVEKIKPMRIFKTQGFATLLCVMFVFLQLQYCKQLSLPN